MSLMGLSRVRNIKQAQTDVSAQYSKASMAIEMILRKLNI